MIGDRSGQKQGVSSEPMGVIQSLRSRIGGWFNSSEPEAELIDHIVNSVEPKLKGVKGYRKRLKDPVRLCREHCRKIVGEIPGPFQLERSGYPGDPVIKAAFAGSVRIEDLLNRVDRATSQTALSGNDRVALLTMTSREKTIYGRKKQGDMIVGDVAMRSITFTDHNIVGLATTLEESRKALERFSLDIIAEAAARELSEIRTRLVDLRQRKEQLRAMKKMFGGGSGFGCVFVPYDPEKQEKQRKLEQMLVETVSEIEAASSESEMPENWLTIVENFLSKPEDILSLQRVSLRLDWSNVLTDDPDEKAETITFATFTLADEMQREGVLVTYKHV